jgi:hypothetical protein
MRDAETREQLTKPGLGPFGSRLLRLFAEAIEGAAATGVSRETIAAKLGVSLHTVHAWMKSSSTNRTPFDRFFELACREDILPESVRSRLWSKMGYEAGFVVFPEEQAECAPASPFVQLTQVEASFGRVAQSVRSAVQEQGEAGPKISKAESKDFIDRLRELETDIARLRGAVERLG